MPRGVVLGPFDRPLRILRLVQPPISQGRLPGEPDKYKQLEEFIEVPVEWKYADPNDEDAIVAALPGCDVYLGVIFKKSMTPAADALKMIALHAAGYEKIDPASVPDGVVVVNAYEHEAPIAEWVMMAAELLDHHVIEADRRLRENDWGMWIYRRPPRVDAPLAVDASRVDRLPREPPSRKTQNLDNCSSKNLVRIDRCRRI